MKLFFTGIILVTSMLGVISCDSNIVEKSRKEILETEKAFCEMAAEKGVKVAFMEFADSNVAMARGNKLILGQRALADYYATSKSDSNSKLNWTPEFVEVSKSGDLGYTYGYYTFVVTDSSGIQSETKGVFHTVWKKQDNGTWKFVWD